MENSKKLILDCMSYLWSLSKRSEDYWHYVGSFEQEEAFSYFSSLIKHPTQLGVVFGQLSREEHSKVYNTLVAMTARHLSVKPGFFEISLWAILIDVRSTAMRREFLRLAIEVDALSRRIVGAPSEMFEKELTHYIELAKKYVSISKHIHPAFAHSDQTHAPALKKDLATGS